MESNLLSFPDQHPVDHVQIYRPQPLVVLEQLDDELIFRHQLQ